MRRIDWQNIGHTIADYGDRAIREEFLSLRALVEKEVGRRPEKVKSRELIWSEGIYDVSDSYDLIAYEKGISVTLNSG